MSSFVRPGHRKLPSTSSSSSPTSSPQQQQQPASSSPPVLECHASSSSSMLLSPSSYRERLLRGMSNFLPESPRNALLQRSRMGGGGGLCAPQPLSSLMEECAVARTERGTLARLPPELLQRVLQLLMVTSESFGCVRTLSLVSRYWYSLVQHPCMWRTVVKLFFISYPVVQRLARAAPIDEEEEALLMSRIGISSSSSISGMTKKNKKRPGGEEGVPPGEIDAQPATQSASCAPAGYYGLSPLPSPKDTNDDDPLELTNNGIRKAYKDVKRYLASRRYHELVQRRRAFVIHAFFSLSLLCFSMALLTAMCAGEGLDPITICNADTSFHFVWLTYVSITGAVIANIVMETHFEPQPLIRRLRMHTRLIEVSAAALTAGMLVLGLPTLLLQWNVQSLSAANGGERQQYLPWAVCILPIFVVLLAWQAEVLFAVRRDISEFLQRPYFNSLTMYHGFSYSTPTLFILALLCLTQYMERRGDPEYWGLLLIGTLPGGLSIFTLTIVFLMDYSLKSQSSDIVAALCLAIANVCPILIATMQTFRGFTILPLVIASFGFFFGHFQDLRRRVDAAMFDPDGERVLFDD